MHTCTFEQACCDMACSWLGSKFKLWPSLYELPLGVAVCITLWPTMCHLSVFSNCQICFSLVWINKIRLEKPDFDWCTLEFFLFHRNNMKVLGIEFVCSSTTSNTCWIFSLPQKQHCAWHRVCTKNIQIFFFLLFSSLPWYQHGHGAAWHSLHHVPKH